MAYLTVFAYTPFNEGTIAGLNAIKRLRDAIPIWDQLPDLIARGSSLLFGDSAEWSPRQLC